MSSPRISRNAIRPPLASNSESPTTSPSTAKPTQLERMSPGPQPPPNRAPLLHGLSQPQQSSTPKRNPLSPSLPSAEQVRRVLFTWVQEVPGEEMERARVAALIARSGVVNLATGQITFKGDLDLCESTISTLPQALHRVDGDVSLDDCPNLRDTGGLAHVSGDLGLNDCPELLTVGKLNHAGCIYAARNPKLVGFPCLETAEMIDASENNVLVEFSELKSVTYSLDAPDNPRLIGFPKLKSVGGTLDLSRSPRLADLGSLETIGGNAYLSGCERLTLPKLSSVETLHIEKTACRTIESIQATKIYPAHSLIPEHELDAQRIKIFCSQGLGHDGELTLEAALAAAPEPIRDYWANIEMPILDRLTQERVVCILLYSLWRSGDVHNVDNQEWMGTTISWLLDQLTSGNLEVLQILGDAERMATDEGWERGVLPLLRPIHTLRLLQKDAEKRRARSARK